MKIRTTRAAFLAAFLLAQPALLQADTYYVQVDSHGFSPSTLTIALGDDVFWVNADEDDFPHTTTSTLPFLNPDYWNGQMFSYGDSFAKTFNTLGTFTYRDQADLGTGSITVVAAAPTGITLGAPRRAAGLFLFDVIGLTPGNLLVLQSSTNLTTWTSLSTNLTASGTITITNAATLNRNFFRVYEIQQINLPNRAGVTRAAAND